MSMNVTELPQILFVDDDVDLLAGAELMFRNSYRILTASSVSAAKAMVRNSSIQTAVVDLDFSGQEADGLAFIDWMTAEFPDLPLIVLSGDKVTNRVVGATKRRLVDFVPKAGDYWRDLKMAIHTGIELYRQRHGQETAFQFQTRSPAVRRVLEIVEKIAKNPSNVPILITGETGSGKEVLAKHFAARVRKKLVAANMASIPKDTAESELFGHLKGSFTGAHMDRPGLIMQAHNGLFFLDELGECSPAVQAKLLRVIQEQEVLPLGAVQPRKISTRFLAATNRDLEAMVEGNEFRMDLLQRLNAVTLRLPPLRERPEDIEFYTMTFLSELAGERPFTIRASGIEALLTHSWKGNTRELRNVIERIVIFADRRELDGDIVQSALGDRHKSIGTGALPFISEYENLRSRILHALEQTDGNRAQAAKLLNMHKTTVFRWIKKFGIGEIQGNGPGRPRLAGRMA